MTEYQQAVRMPALQWFDNLETSYRKCFYLCWKSENVWDD